VLSAPLWLLIVLAIHVDDGGAVLLREERWGRGGKAFLILKFRTTALRPTQAGAELGITGERYFSRVGRFLRAVGLDELPQLINIWRGEMSCVGPRPLAVIEIPAHTHSDLLRSPEFEGLRERLSVRPGLTGIAQIYGSKYWQHRRKFRLDKFYINHQSFLLDLKLILLSIWLSLRGKWEVSSKKL
jgi:lipopolysaccharide/colanic/teichoic acid biosynthesis glycosyltransferase